MPALSSLDSGSMLETAKHAHAHHSHVGHHHALDMDHKSIALTAAVVSIGVKEGLVWSWNLQFEVSSLHSVGKVCW